MYRQKFSTSQGYRHWELTLLRQAERNIAAVLSFLLLPLRESYVK